MRDSAAEATVAAIANKVTYAGSGTAVVFGLTANEIAAVGGLIVAILGVIVQWFYKRKSDRRESELHAARLKDLWGKE